MPSYEHVEHKSLNIYLREKCFEQTMHRGVKHVFYVYDIFSISLKVFDTIKQKRHYANTSEILYSILSSNILEYYTSVLLLTKFKRSLFQTKFIDLYIHLLYKYI
jgi:hypothetical protein